MTFSKKYFSTSILLLLVVIVLCGLHWYSKENILLLAIPGKPPVFQKENIEINNPFYSFYSVFGWDGPNVSVSQMEEGHLESLNIKEGTYQFGCLPNLSPLCDSIIAVWFEPSDFDMARTMCLYTDNLATHDCLFRMVLSREFYYTPQKTGRFIYDVIESLVASFNNLNTWLTFSKGVILSNPFSVRAEMTPKEYKYRQHTLFKYAYCDYTSRQIYLIERISKQEVEWDIKYYPTVLVGYSVIDNPQFIPIHTGENGGLYGIAEPLSFSEEQYEYSGREGLFVRIVGNLEATKDEITLSIENYFNHTTQMNQTILSYFKTNKGK